MIVSGIKVEYLDKMGSDLSVVNAARVSFDKVSESFSDGDRRLINYLAKHNHWSPFAHTSLQLRIKAPMFVARQLGKHQVGLVWNEVSRRYVDSEPEYYIPDSLHRRPENMKQGAGNETLPGHYIDQLVLFTEYADKSYRFLLEAGVAPEEARMVLPLNTHTEWIWTGNVMSFVRVCQQRLHSHAQRATAEVATQINKIGMEHFPESWKALMLNYKE